MVATMVKEDVVRKIQDASRDVVRATTRRDQLVRRARDSGATWTQLGYALGISAQGAQKRYGDTQERTEAYLARQAERKSAREQARGSDTAQGL